MKKCFTVNQTRSFEFIEESIVNLLDSKIYQAIEIFYPYDQPIEQYKMYTSEIKKIHQKYKDLEIVMHLPFGPKHSLCDFTNIYKNVGIMKDAIRYCSGFGTKKLTLHLGYCNPNVNRSIYINHIVQILRELADYSNEYKMALMIENMPTNSELGYSPSEIKDIITLVDKPNLCFILDTGHANVSEYSIDEYIDVLKNKLYHLHLSDNMGKCDEHKRIGLGNIDFKKFIQKMEEINYQELFCLEILHQNYQDLINYADDLDKQKQ